MHVLLIEDDVELAHQLETSLVDAGHGVTLAFDGIVGEELAATCACDVMVIDRMLPKRDGLSVLRNLRAEKNDVPALILSALGQVDDRVEGLRAGGDDYLAKPYAISELLARIEVLAKRRDTQTGDTILQIGDLKLDRINHSADRAGTKIVLQPREYRLLDYLMQNEGRIVTRTMLLEHVWDLHFDPQTNVIDVHVSRLRAKIDKDFPSPLLHTIRGKGYRMANRDVASG